MSRPAVLDVLAQGYGPLFDRVLAVTEADERIRALWLSGSLARGVADAASDLDLLLAVRDADHAAFAGGWREWLAGIAPTVVARALPSPAAAVALADSHGSPRQRLLARVRLAHAHQWRRDWAEGDALFARCLADADTAPDVDDRARAFVLQHAGENHFDQGRWPEAAELFARSLALRQGAGDEALAESSRQALDAARGRSTP